MEEVRKQIKMLERNDLGGYYIELIDYVKEQLEKAEKETVKRKSNKKQVVEEVVEQGELVE